MSRIAPVVVANTETKVAATVSQMGASLGIVPDVFATLEMFLSRWLEQLHQ
jgi:hypothetical protein